jgi:hypothetical protein
VLGTQPTTVSGVTIVSNFTFLSDNALLVGFRLENSNSSNTSADVAVYSDIYFDGDDNAPVAGLPDEQGFVIYSSSNAFGVICRSYPLVRNVSAYNFAAFTNFDRWAQTSASSLSMVDSAMAFSWQNITIPSGGAVTLSAIMRSGNFDTQLPVLTIDQVPTGSGPPFDQFLLNFPTCRESAPTCR